MKEKRKELKFGLLGRKLSHSFSPFIHEAIGAKAGYRYGYELKEIEPKALKTFMEETDLDGFNVTIPYKEQVVRYCSQLSDLAKRIGVVNTVVRCEDGWHGYNTDYKGFCYMIERSGIDVCGKAMVVLGAGGVSKTVQAALTDLGAVSIKVLSHSEIDSLAKGEDFGDLVKAQIMINATPVGMFPDCSQSPLELSKFSQLEAVFDLIYNPERTQFMMEAKEKGAAAFGGMEMLVNQACEAAEIFLKESKSVAETEVISICDRLRKEMPDLVQKCKRKMQNIVLVGMPGSGKSTLGRKLAAATGKFFVDSDLLIEERENRTIPQIFEEDRETGFRKLETQILAELGGGSGQDIATGGGCVTREENYKLLHRNAVIIWVQRSLEDLAIEGRPISQARSLKDLYEERERKYEAFADFAITCDGGEEKALIKAMEGLKAWKY